MQLNNTFDVESYGYSQYTTKVKNYTIHELNDSSQTLQNLINLSALKQHLNYTTLTGDVSEWEGAMNDDNLLEDTLNQTINEIENILFFPIMQKTYRVYLKLNEDTETFILPTPNIQSIYEITQNSQAVTSTDIEYLQDYCKITVNQKLKTNSGVNLKIITGYNNTNNIMPQAIKLAILKYCAYHWANRGDYDAYDKPHILNLIQKYMRYPECDYSTSFELNTNKVLPDLCQFN